MVKLKHEGVTKKNWAYLKLLKVKKLKTDAKVNSIFTYLSNPFQALCTPSQFTSMAYNQIMKSFVPISLTIFIEQVHYTKNIYIIYIQ